MLRHTHRPYRRRDKTRERMMRMKIDFFMAMVPPTVTAQEHKVMVRNGRPVFYDPPELKAARQKLTDHLAKHRPAEKLTGPVSLHVMWCFPVKSVKLEGEWKITKPDTDNLNKLLKDCMTKVGFWEDDAQVCCEVIEKHNVTESPSGIYVSIEQL